MRTTPVAEQSASEPPPARVRDQARDAVTLMLFSCGLSGAVAAAALLVTDLLQRQGR